MGIIKNIEKLSSYQKELNGHPGKLILIDFHAQWCGPCHSIAPSLKTIAERNDIIVLKVDVDEAEEITRLEEVSAMPTFKLYKNNHLVSQFEGANEEQLRQVVRANL